MVKVLAFSTTAKTEKMQKHFKALIDYYNMFNEKFKLNQPF